MEDLGIRIGTGTLGNKKDAFGRHPGEMQKENAKPNCISENPSIQKLFHAHSNQAASLLSHWNILVAEVIKVMKKP